MAAPGRSHPQLWTAALRSWRQLSWIHPSASGGCCRWHLGWDLIQPNPRPSGWGQAPIFSPDKNAYQGIGALLMWCQEVRIRIEVIIPARDPKQCVVRIRKGKVERIQNQQWFQASRIRVTLVVKEWCSFKVVSGRRDTRLDSASSLCEDFCKKSWTSSPWQVLCRSCCARSFCKANCTRSLQEITTKDRKRSLSKTSVQALYRRSLSKISVLFTRSLYKISKRIIRGLLRSPGKIFVYKISIRALLARSL